MRRREFLSSAAAAVVDRQGSRETIHEPSIREFQHRMEHHALTAEGLAAFYMRRIEEMNHRGPALHAVIETNPHALKIARDLDVERRKKGSRSALHGIPILLKDNIDTHDRMETTAGSMALAGAPIPTDAFVVQRLRAAGAVLLGKANLSEWANFRSSHSTSGWSARGGLTKNPYALDRNACGSSSGSAVAVSANLCAAAIGTETDGSIVCPCSMNGIVGIKPTLGLISRSGIIPIAHSQDTAGPIARTILDAAILLTVLAGSDSSDPATRTTDRTEYSDYTRFLDPNGLRGARLGVARQYLNMGPAVTSLIEHSLAAMQTAGATVVDETDLETYEDWRASEMIVLQYEFKADLNRYLAARGGAVKSLGDCIAFNRAHAAQEMPYFAQELMEMSQEKGSLEDKTYKDALATCRRLTRKQGIDAVLAKYKLDAIVAPTAGPAFVTDLVTGDRVDSGCASPPAVSGYPHITVPAGYVFGLPVGISFFGPPWSEPKLIRFAYAFEQTQPTRRPPQFLPTANLRL